MPTWLVVTVLRLVAEKEVAYVVPVRDTEEVESISAPAAF